MTSVNFDILKPLPPVVPVPVAGEEVVILVVLTVVTIVVSIVFILDFFFVDVLTVVTTVESQFHFPCGTVLYIPGIFLRP